jgi:uncharacterized damage-inducible protein DinB
MPLIDAILSELDMETKTTRRVLERVPTDKLEWRPHAKSMSLGQLALHVAQIPGSIAAWVDKPVLEFASASAGSPQKSGESTTHIMSELDASHAKASGILQALDDRTLLSPWSFKMDGKTLMTMPRVAVVRTLLLNHWYHHRGQLSVYLRELDVAVPSIYGPSADENPFLGG